MACWTDFSHMIDQHLAEYDPYALEIATVQAAIEVGNAVGGFSDSMEVSAVPYLPQTSCALGGITDRPAYTVSVAIAPPPGFRLFGVSSVSMNGKNVPRQGVRFDYTCARYQLDDCGTITILPVASSVTPTVRVNFTTLPVYGQVTAAMPDFLLGKYNIPMMWKILSLLSKGRASEAFEHNYLRAIRQMKNRVGPTIGIVGGKMV